MDIEKYRALLCVIETGSLSAAAETLGYTPSGISRMMAALEEENGFRLLLRSRDGAVPTQECKKMLPSIRELVFCGEKCRQLAEGMKGLETGNVVVGTAYSSCYEPLAQMASEFHEIYPGIQVQFRNGYSTELVRLMEKRQVDICIISRREGIDRWVPLKEDPVVAWLPNKHPLASCEYLSPDIFSKESYIEIYPGQDSDNARILEKCGIKPNTMFSTMDSFAAYSMVKAGLGIAMNNGMNEPGMTEGIKIIPLKGVPNISIGIAFLEKASLASEKFMEFMNAHLERLQV